MGHLSREFIQRVKDATNLYDLISDYTELSSAGHNLWMARCPHPDHEDSTPSFRVRHNEDGGWSWWCGGCHCGPKNLKNKKNKNYGSDCFAFLQWISDYKGSKHKIEWREAVEILAKRAGIPMEEDKYDGYCKVLYGIAVKDHRGLRDLKDALEYLEGRGLDSDDLARWKIGARRLREMGEEVTRITFPLFSRYNRVVGVSERLLGWTRESRHPKYRNSRNNPVFNKSSYLYGLHRYDSNFPELRITEGAMDVVTADKFGVKNVVGTLGTAFTREHVHLIKALGAAPCFCLDGDAAGQKGTRKAVELLSEAGIYAKVCILPDGKDLADFSLELGDEIEEYIENHTMNYWEYLLIEPTKIYQAKLTEVREKILPAIIAASKGTTSPEDRLMMKSTVKERFGITL